MGGFMLKVVKNNSNDLESEENKIPFQSVSMDIWDKKYRLKSKKAILLIIISMKHITGLLKR